MIKIDERYLTNDTLVKIMTELNYDLTKYTDDKGEIDFIRLREYLAIVDHLYRINRRQGGNEPAAVPRGTGIFYIFSEFAVIKLSKQVSCGGPPTLPLLFLIPVPAFVVVFFSCFYMLNKNKQLKCLPAPYAINLPGFLVYCLYKYYIINLLEFQVGLRH